MGQQRGVAAAGGRGRGGGVGRNRYLVRANAATALEGSWDADRIVVLEFPTRADALAWYHSPQDRDLHWSAAEAVIMLAGGVEPPG